MFLPLLLLAKFVGIKSAAMSTLWGGFLSDLTLFGGGYALLKHHNCAVHGCFRIGKVKTAAGHSVCKKHHPDPKPLTHQDIIDSHNLAVKADHVAAESDD